MLPVGIFVAFTGLFAGSVLSSLTPAVEVVALPVVERPSIKGTAPNQGEKQQAVVVQAAGWIEPDPFAVYAATLIDGIVKEVSFLEGNQVAKGDLLVRLIDDDARLMLERAQVEARAAEESWQANIEAQRESMVAGASVDKTQASLELARAELEAERAVLRGAKDINDRTRVLVGEALISHEEHDRTEATAQAQAARVRVVERRIDELKAQLQGVQAEQAAAQRRLELRTDERRHLELTRVALEEARLRLERTVIRASIDGVIMQRVVEPGSMVRASSDNPEMGKVAALYDPKKLQVRVDVPLADVAKVGVGQLAKVLVEVLPDALFSGKVTRITNFADIQKNTLEVKVALDDPAPELKPDMLARVRFLAAPQASDSKAATGTYSVFAPASAVGSGIAWVVTQYDGEEGLAARRDVTTTGAEADGWEEIASGLQPGDLVVVSPPENLKPNQRVRVRKGGI